MPNPFAEFFVAPDKHTVKATSGVMLTMIIFWTLFDILQIMSYNVRLTQLYAYTSIILNALYLVAWIVILFLGSRLRLGLGGYVGTGLMLFGTLFTLGMQLFIQNLVLENGPAGLDHYLLVGNAISIVSALSYLIGISLFMCSVKVSLRLRMTVPGYFAIQVLLCQVLAWMLHIFEVPLTTYLAIAGILLLVCVLVIVLPLYVHWSTRSMARIRAATTPETF